MPIDGLPVITDQIVFRQCQTLHKAARVAGNVRVYFTWLYQVGRSTLLLPD